ncbi:MAG TPA: class I SAM-dependent methyltransferase [Micromonosporaceae bacterium]
MDRHLRSLIAHTDHPIAAPLRDASVERLLRRARLPRRARLLDLGCGEAGWLLRALELYPESTADGVDVSGPALDRAARAATARGVADRLSLHRTDATGFPVGERYHLVCCVGVAHVFGGLRSTVDAARRYLRSDGLILVGDGFWDRSPDAAALAGLGARAEDLRDLAGTVAELGATGCVPVYGHVSDADEWDEYEWSWSGTLASWALDNPTDPDASDALAAATTHLEGWLGGYRGVLGFVTVLLRCPT